MQIDLNADVGEGYATDAQLIPLLSSANICCGAHAGSQALTASTLDICASFGVAAGAHPSYPDRASFGRQRLALTDASLADSLSQQLDAFKSLCANRAIPVHHVKPHGALYNDVIKDQQLAQLLLDTVQRVFPKVSLMTLPFGALFELCHARQIPVIAEGFADRQYQADGTLTPRSQPNALLTGHAAVTQALKLASGAAIAGMTTPLTVQSICVHGDSQDAVQLAQTIRQQLLQRGVCITKVYP